MKKTYLLKQLCAFTGLYIMLMVVCGTGLLLSEASTGNIQIAFAEESDTEVIEEETTKPMVLSSPEEDTSMFHRDEELLLDVVAQGEDYLYDVLGHVKIEYFDVPVKLKSNVNGLNIRSEQTTDSDILGVIYQGEIAVASIPFANGEVYDVDWVEIESGFISIDYIEIIEDELDMTEYRTTGKGTFTKNPILTYNVTSPSYVSVSDLAQVTKGTGLEGVERTIVRMEEEFGINGLFIHAVATLESASGNSEIAKAKNNLFGMNAQDKDPFNLAFSYNSFSESIIDFCDRITRVYLDQGRTTLKSINERYSTDPNWNTKVADIMARTYTQIIE